MYTKAYLSLLLLFTYVPVVAQSDVLGGFRYVSEQSPSGNEWQSPEQLALIARFDILCSSLLALLIYLLTYKYEWNTPIYIIGAIVIFAVSMLLQHFLKGFRIIYGIFACVVTSLLGPAFIGYDSNVKMYLTMAVCFGVTALWGIISWRCIIKK